MLIIDGDGDVVSQGELLRDLLSCPVTLVHFRAASGGGGHREGLWATPFGPVAFDWTSSVPAAP